MTIDPFGSFLAMPFVRASLLAFSLSQAMSDVSFGEFDPEKGIRKLRFTSVIRPKYG
tara:strand:- start:235 stop:405 length:171 start_codon:yes stop_codon:yes gene_type:complete